MQTLRTPSTESVGNSGGGVSRLVVVILVSLTILAWVTHWQRVSLKAANQAAFNDLRYQFILAGVSVDLDRITTVTRGSSSVGQRPTVVIVVSDECPYCHQDVPLWQRLIEAMPPSAALDIVAKRGEEIASHLFAAATARRLSVSVRVPTGTTQFNVGTGWRGTPATVLLTKDKTIGLFVPRMTDSALRQIQSELSAQLSFAGRPRVQAMGRVGP